MTTSLPAQRTSRSAEHGRVNRLRRAILGAKPLTVESLEARTFLSASVHDLDHHAPPPSHNEPAVYAPHSTVRGETLGQWTAAWWQWAFSHNVDQSPFFDQTGARAGLGDVGKAFFLSGVISVSGTAERTITIPSGKPVFFPVLNTECSTIESPPYHGNTDQELRDCASAIDSPATAQPMHMTIDGTSLSQAEIETHYEASAPFNFTLPSTGVNILEFFGEPLALPGTTARSASTGWWIMTKPLAPGHHDINFGGGDPTGFVLDITYHIDVVPQGQYEHDNSPPSHGSENSPPDHSSAQSNPFNHQSRIGDNVLGSAAGGVL